MPERKYNEAELAAILRAAAEAQSAGMSSSDDNPGYSLSDIERLAGEVGIDPKHIANAAENLPLEQQVERRFRFWGPPTRQTIERTYEGTLDDLSWEESVGELRFRFSNAGTVSTVGSSREWVGGNEFRIVHLSATPRNGKTRLRLTINQKDMLAVAWMSGILITIFGSIFVAIISRQFALVNCLLVALVGYLAVRHMLLRWNAKSLAMVDSVLDRIQDLTPKSTDTLTGNLEPQLTHDSIESTQADETVEVKG